MLEMVANIKGTNCHSQLLICPFHATTPAIPRNFNHRNSYELYKKIKPRYMVVTIVIFNTRRNEFNHVK